MYFSYATSSEKACENWSFTVYRKIGHYFLNKQIKLVSADEKTSINPLTNI